MPPDNEREILLRVGVMDKHILEFGNKRNAGGPYRDWYLSEGVASYTCIDWNGEDGALPIDVRGPMRSLMARSALGYDLITNFGFSEHVEGAAGQAAFFRNVHDLCSMGGIMIHMVPLVGQWEGHYEMHWVYTKDFIDELCKDNWYRGQRSVDESRGEGKALLVGVLVKMYEAPFRWVDAAAEVVAC